jgi:predicted DNA-binding transcriptional regulator YafY
MDQNFPRLLDVLRLIPVGHKVTATQIHQCLESLGYQTTRRTLERDLAALATHYGIVCDRRSKPYGWSWGARADIPVIHDLGLTQALSLKLLERECADLIPASAQEVLKPWFGAAKKRLQNASHTQTAKYEEKILIAPSGSPLLAAKIPKGVMDGVQGALFLGKQIQARYRSKHQEQSKAIHINPLGLIRTELITYLVAIFDGFTDPRLLALHRLSQIQILEVKSIPPKGFDLQAYAKSGALQFGQGKLIKLQFRMSDAAVAHLSETPLSKDQIITPDGKAHFLVSATVQDSPRLQWWLKGFGKQVKVLLPKNYLTGSHDD